MLKYFAREYNVAPRIRQTFVSVIGECEKQGCKVILSSGYICSFSEGVLELEETAKSVFFTLIDFILLDKAVQSKGKKLMEFTIIKGL